MSRSHLFSSFSGSLALLACLASGCSNAPAEPGVDAGRDAPAIPDAPVVDAPEREDVRGDAPPPRDVGPDDDAGEASVRWTTEVSPVTVDHDIALDYAYQYEVTLVGDPLAYSLVLDRCIQIAGMAETCETVPRDALSSPSSVRWGVDPSMYAIGENHYRFTLTLSRDADVVDTDVVELVLTATDCTSCVGH